MNDTVFSISDAAAARIAHLLKQEPAGARLRIAVDGGGCSGFQYRFDFDANAPAIDDTVISNHGVEVVIDAVSLPFVQHGMIDYVTKLGAAYFEIKNPNSTANCGCGNSFAV